MFKFSAAEIVKVCHIQCRLSVCTPVCCDKVYILQQVSEQVNRKRPLETQFYNFQPINVQMRKKYHSNLKKTQTANFLSLGHSYLQSSQRYCSKPQQAPTADSDVVSWYGQLSQLLYLPGSALPARVFATCVRVWQSDSGHVATGVQWPSRDRTV